jgi:hypothetical protein
MVTANSPGPAPNISAALEALNSLKLIFDSDAKIESSTDINGGQWQRIDQPSPFRVNPDKPMEFFRAVRPVF